MNLIRSHGSGLGRTLIVLSALAAGSIFPAWQGFAQIQTTTSGQPTEADPLKSFGSRQIRAHDPSTIIKCSDEYWVFCTGRGILTYHSKDLVHWEPGPPVLSTLPAWIAGVVATNHLVRDLWAPDIIRQGDRFLLYYSASSFGKNTSAIGLATNPTLDPADLHYHWTDEGIVIQSRSGDDFNAIDPSVARDAEGNLWLAFGSYWSGIRMIALDRATGKRAADDSRLRLLAHSQSIEASCVSRHGDWYYLFVNWGSCCRGTNSTYNIRVGRSPKITGPYLDRDGVDMALGGGSLFLDSTGPFIGPGHAGILTAGTNDWFSCHFYDGTRHGTPTLAILPLHWSTDGWPEVVVAPFP